MMSATKIVPANTEYVERSRAGDLLCVCGNKPSGTGFFPVNARNEEVEPTLEDWPRSLYACFQCGRIIDQASLEVVRRVELAAIKALP
jgi:hypothetical protein